MKRSSSLAMVVVCAALGACSSKTASRPQWTPPALPVPATVPAPTTDPAAAEKAPAPPEDADAGPFTLTGAGLETLKIAQGWEAAGLGRLVDHQRGFCLRRHSPAVTAVTPVTRYRLSYADGKLQLVAQVTRATADYGAVHFTTYALGLTPSRFRQECGTQYLGALELGARLTIERQCPRAEAGAKIAPLDVGASEAELGRLETALREADAKLGGCGERHLAPMPARGTTLFEANDDLKTAQAFAAAAMAETDAARVSATLAAKLSGYPARK